MSVGFKVTHPMSMTAIGTTFWLGDIGTIFWLGDLKFVKL